MRQDSILPDGTPKSKPIRPRAARHDTGRLGVLPLRQGGPPPSCDRGAFAEFRYVHAIATDGRSTLTYLDGPRGGASEIGLKAFAPTP